MQESNDLFFDALVRGYVEENPRFLRRHWLAEELDAKLHEPGKRFVLLTAEPGAGKSAVVAQLAHDHPEWLRYFIRRDQRSVLSDVSDKSLLLRIGYQLAALRPELFFQEQLRVSVEQRIGKVSEKGEAVGAEFNRLTASPFYQKILQIEQHVQTNQGKLIGLRVEELVIETRLIPAEDLLHLALIDPARALQRIDPKRLIVILIDALDEIRYHQTPENILAWLTKSPDELPENIHFVLTSRPPDEMLKFFCDEKASRLSMLAIAEEDAHVKQDIEQFVANLVREPEVAQTLQTAEGGAEAFAKKATDKAHGNLGYLDALARGIDQAARSNDQAGLQVLLSLKELPGDLGELYAFFLHQIKAAVSRERIELKDSETGETYDKPIWPAVYDRILGVLAVAMEPLDIDLIEQLGGIHAERSWVLQALERLLQFLDVVNGRYHLYHATVPEFLTAEKTRANRATTDLYQDGKRRHREIANYYWQVYRNRWRECKNDRDAGRYLLCYLMKHMREATMWHELGDLLIDLNYLQAQIDPAFHALTLFEWLQELEESFLALPKAHHMWKQIEGLYKAICANSYIMAEEEKPILADPILFVPHMYNVLIQDWEETTTLGQNLRAAIESYTEPFLKLLNYRPPLGHREGVISLLFSPDGKLLASGSKDGTVLIWDTETVSQRQVLYGHGPGVYSLALSPDEETLVGGTGDGTITGWNLKTGEVKWAFLGHQHRVISIAFSPNGRTIASGSFDGVVRLWDIPIDVHLGTPTHTLFLEQDYPTPVFLAFSPDGKTLASGEGNAALDEKTGEVKIWDLETVELKKRLVGGHGYDEEGEFEMFIAHREPILALAFSPDGSLLASGSEDGLVKLWDAETGDFLCVAGDCGDWVSCLTFSPDSKILAAASFNSWVWLWDVNDGMLLKKLPCLRIPYALWLSQGFPQLKVAGTNMDTTNVPNIYAMNITPKALLKN